MSRLATIPFLQGSEIDLSPFETRCWWRRFEPDEMIVDFDDLSTDVYLISSGRIRVLIRTQSGKEVILADLGAGQIFGELAAIDGISRSANITAISRGEVCVVPATVFREMVWAAPSLVDRLLRLLARRIRETTARLMEHSVLDLRHRLYSELLRLSVPRQGAKGERVVTPPPYHHVLAAWIGCRREQVTRELAVLSHERLVDRTRGALVLKRPEVLEQRIAVALRNGS